MKKVKFIEEKKESYYQYHLPCGNGLLEDSIFYKENLTNELKDKWYSYLLKLGITDYGSQENFLLYGHLIKTLAINEDLYVLTFGNSVEIKENLKPLQLKAIKWKFSFESTIDDGERCRQFGYQTPKEFLNEMNYGDKELSNRGFEISKVNFKDINLFVKTYEMDVTSWSFIINSDWNKLTALLLNADKRPETLELLEFSECIIHIQIGGDEGYLDYVMIQSKLDLKSYIKQIEKQLYDLGNKYEHLISKLGSIDSEEKIEFFQSKLNHIISNEKITQS